MIRVFFCRGIRGGVKVALLSVGLTKSAIGFGRANVIRRSPESDLPAREG